MLDGHRGVYVDGRGDPWLLEQERKEREATPAPAKPDDDAERLQFRDEAGTIWQPFVNHARQRKLRAVAGPRLDSIVDDWRAALCRPPEAERPRQGGFDDSGTIFA